MGKSAEEEHQAPATVVSITSERNAERRRCCCGGCGQILKKHFGLRCVGVLVLSAAVFLSAVFWLPPFLQFVDRGDRDLDPRFRGHDIVATFNVEKPVFLLEDNIPQLEDDIFGEINLAAIRVVILAVEPLAGSNMAKVVFAIDSFAKNSKISSASESLIRELFGSLVTRQYSLRLTASLFGDALSFEVLRFPGGITIIPQSVFPLQKVQIYFNFTLNYSIEQIQANFHDLTSQLKSGLRLTSFENLYISLSNMRGSTVAPPTIVQSSVLLAVGNMPSMPRLKQLAQTITGSHSRNLGLNNTIFGRVKQVRLSSIWQHSLNGGDAGSPSWPPSPAPLPQAHHMHHHHHHHHHHFHNEHSSPAMSPSPATHGSRTPGDHRKRSPVHSESSPAPAPGPSHKARPPGCRTGYKGSSSGSAKKRFHVAPVAAPMLAPWHPVVSPSPQVHHASSVPHSLPPSSPLPHVVFSHAQPPSSSKDDSNNPVQMPAAAPSPYSSSAGLNPTVPWVLLVISAIVLQL